jgi:energy-converting hydrogenase Eha subunit F
MRRVFCRMLSVVALLGFVTPCGIAQDNPDQMKLVRKVGEFANEELVVHRAK